MSRFFDQEHTRRDAYNFKVYGRYDDATSSPRTENISIVFLNGKFSGATFTFRGIYTREEWHILAAINEKITEIEEQLKGE